MGCTKYEEKKTFFYFFHKLNIYKHTHIFPHDIYLVATGYSRKKAESSLVYSLAFAWNSRPYKQTICPSLYTK